MDSLYLSDSVFKINVEYHNPEGHLPYVCDYCESKYRNGIQLIRRHIWYYNKKEKSYNTIEYPLNDRFHQNIYIRTFNGKAVIVRWINTNIHPDLYDMLTIYWEIGSWTKEIHSNLDESFIRRAFPEFKGRFYHDSTKVIQIDNSYEIDQDEFYENIKLIK